MNTAHLVCVVWLMAKWVQVKVYHYCQCPQLMILASHNKAMTSQNETTSSHYIYMYNLCTKCTAVPNWKPESVNNVSYVG